MKHRSILRLRGASLVTGSVLAILVGAAWCEAESQNLFVPIAAVMQHPRCLNCHVEKIPLNGENGRAHRMKITRGVGTDDAKNNFGAPGAHCYACHRDTAVSESSFAPAAPNWQLAPKDMAWQGKTAPQLCVALRGSLERRGWDREKTLNHFTEGGDPLVTASWKGGPGRPNVPIPQDQVLTAVKAWLDANKECP